MAQYVPLQVLSTFSLLHSTSTVSELVQTAKQQGYSTLALTDVDIMYGIVDFYNACRQAEITPILGITLNLLGRELTAQTFSLVVLAKDQAGYQNLMRLSTMKQTATDAGLSLTAVLPYLNHLMVLTPAKDSELAALLLQNTAERAADWITTLRQAVDSASLYLGISLDQAPALRTTMTAFAQQHQLPVVALDPVDYVQAKDYFAVSVLRAIDRGQQIEQPESLQGIEGSHYLRPANTVTADYEQLGLTTAVAATAEIAAQCQVELQFQQPQLPQFQRPLTTSERLFTAVMHGWSNGAIGGNNAVG